jgi:hypothetical protein
MTGEKIDNEQAPMGQPHPIFADLSDGFEKSIVIGPAMVRKAVASSKLVCTET